LRAAMGAQWALPVSSAVPVPHPVMLHIYDLSTDPDVVAVNRVLRSVLGTGAFHCGVEVYFKEWSFRYCRIGTGVFWESPRRCPHASYCDSIFMGNTLMSEAEVYDLLQVMALDWQGTRYDILKRNCCHFSAELCKHLGAGEAFPDWIMNLASTGNDIVEGIGLISEEVDKCDRCIMSHVDTLADSAQVESSLLCGNVSVCCGRRGAQAGGAVPRCIPSVPAPTGLDWEVPAGADDGVLPVASQLRAAQSMRARLARGGDEVEVRSW